MPLLSLILTLEVSAQCAVDGFNPNANNSVRAMVVQPDGKILVGGDFTTLSPNGGPAVVRNYIARLNPDGTLDPGFNPNADAAVYSIALQADGKILVGGVFSNIGGQPRNRMARLDATTGAADSLDPGGTGGTGSVDAIAVQADGKILVGGFFTNIGGQARTAIARLDPATGAADSFDPNANFGTFGPGEVFAIALQADGKIVVGGFFSSIGGQTRRYIARLDPATGAADSFDPNADDVVFSLAVQPDGKILAGGRFDLLGGQPRSSLGRVDGTTGLADVFNGRANGEVRSIAVQADGRVLAGGTFHIIGGQTRDGLARLNGTNANAEASFNAQSNGSIYAIAILPDGKVLVGGNFGSIGRRTRNRIAKLDPDCIPAILGNISTRLRVLSGDNALIGGMIVTGGNVTKSVILRALGPVLTDFGVPGALADPTLELYQGNSLIDINDNWRESSFAAAIEAFGLAPTKDAEAAIYRSLTPGQNYTAIVRGKNGTTGVGVVEVYDINQGVSSYLGNISTRGFVDVDDNVMIAGLIVSPSNGSSAKVLVRALGPTLGDFGVAGALSNPTLDLVNSSGTVIRSNDNWKEDAQQRALIEAAGLGPSHDVEAAMVETLPPGAYTGVVRGSARSTGIGLVEVYNIE